MEPASRLATRQKVALKPDGNYLIEAKHDEDNVVLLKLPDPFRTKITRLS